MSRGLGSKFIVTGNGKGCMVMVVTGEQWKSWDGVIRLLEKLIHVVFYSPRINQNMF